MGLDYDIEQHAEVCMAYAEFIEGLIEPPVNEEQEADLIEREEAGEFLDSL